MARWISSILFFGLCSASALSHGKVETDQAHKAQSAAELETAIADKKVEIKALEEKNMSLKSDLKSNQDMLNGKERTLEDKDQEIRNIKDQIRTLENKTAQ